MLSNWRRMYPELCTEEKQRRHRRWNHAPLDIKLETIQRCYINGESIKSAANPLIVNGYFKRFFNMNKWVHFIKLHSFVFLRATINRLHFSAASGRRSVFERPLFIKIGRPFLILLRVVRSAFRVVQKVFYFSLVSFESDT